MAFMKTLSSIHIYPVKSCKGIKLEPEGSDKKKPLLISHYIEFNSNGLYKESRASIVKVRIAESQ